MRFGADFRQSQTLEAAPFYIAYDELKKDLKLASGPQVDGVNGIRDVSSRLLSQCARTRRYFKVELDDLSAVFERVAYIAAQQKPRSHVRVLQADVPSTNEWQPQIFRAVYLGLHERMGQLLLFAKTNVDAASRIFMKLERTIAKANKDLSELTSPQPLPEWPEALHLEAAIRQRLREIPKNSHSREDDDLSGEGELNRLLTSTHGARADLEDGAPPISTLSWLIVLADFDLKQRAVEATVTDDRKAIRVAQKAWERLILSFVRQAAENEPESSVTVEAGSSYGRSPLHYAAKTGIPRVIAELLKSGYRTDKTDSIGLLPIHLAACNGHGAAVQMLLPALSELLSKHNVEAEMVTTLARQLLVIGDVDTLREALIYVGDVNTDDRRGHNLLCEAARIHANDAAALLLASGANPNVVEKSSGATPLGIAASIPDAALVRLLLGNRAAVDVRDAQGWTPMEHAAYRGHMEVVQTLGNDGAVCAWGEQTISTCPSRYRKDVISNYVPWLQEDPGSGGSYVWITLGSIDATAQTPAVMIYKDMDGQSVSNARHSQVLYTLSVTIDDELSTSYECALPVLGCHINEPWFFRARDPGNLKVRWKLLRESLDSKMSHAGSGYTLLSTMSFGLRPNKESLVRGATTVLQSHADSSAIGTVSFSYHIVTPHPPPQHLEQPTFWQFGDGIGGHRGSGKNRIDHKQLQLGENTAQSFLTAVEHGASFIEFDVQLTKDLVPVVYHDFLLSETGTDSRMQDLFLDQFEYISQAQDPRPTHGKRSLSLGAMDFEHLDALAERMAHTYFNKVNGFKANTRGQFIHEKPSSLENIFRAVPRGVPMNIELKYPMLFECDEWDMELLALRSDLFVSAVLDKVYEHMEGRTIVLSSFSPEICIALSTKQRTLPVFFLSKTSAPRGEIRAESVQQAVHFARSWGLPGIVTECTPLAKCPRLISYVKSAGLTITSFGASNAEVAHAKASRFLVFPSFIVTYQYVLTIDLDTIRCWDQCNH